LSLDEAAAAVAAHLGEVDETKINNMAYVWFNLVLEALGKRINFESISNLYGNSFAQKSQEIIQAANPLVKNGGRGSTSIADLAGSIKIIKKKTDEGTKNAEELRKAAESALGDLSWAKEFFEKEK